MMYYLKLTYGGLPCTYSYIADLHNYALNATQSPTLSYSWITDTGATSHMTGNLNLLHNIHTVNPINIRTASNNVIITRMGTTF